MHRRGPSSRVATLTLLTLVLACGCSDGGGPALEDATGVDAPWLNGSVLPIDVSILLPVADGATTLRELPALRSDDHAFLDLAQLRVVAFDFMESLPDDLQLLDLRWVSMRIEPCAAPEACPAIRLVFQPMTGADAALHAFYRVDDDRARMLIQQLVQLREQYAPELSAVAPDWSVHEGLRANGAYRTAVVGLVRQLASKDTLVRLAAFGFPGSFPDVDGSQRWTFRVADLIAGQWTLQPVHLTTAATTQSFDTNAFVDPATRTTRDVSTASPLACSVAYASEPSSALLQEGAAALGTACSEPLAAATMLASARAFLDPGQTQTAHTDCVSCHLSPVVARMLAERFPANLEADIAPDDLGPPAAGIMRAFGYHKLGGSLLPVVSPRVRIETQATLSALAR